MLHSREESELEFGRVLAFSDGVFAIAITLLVLSIDVPSLSGPRLDPALPDELWDLRYQVLAYFISFGVVGLYWVRHHRLLGNLSAFDGPLMALNLFVLCFIALLPVPTELLGEHSDQAWGIWPYALCMALVSIGMSVLYHYARREGLLRDPPETAIERRRESVRITFPAVVFLLSIPIAFVSPALAVCTWVGGPIVRAVLQRRPASS
ncbi:MAG: DUF1211 domain-containing protein [Solirubrobacteraceae bacterium]|nr:DUF1211 domain-containing protein [Solirubrobacteraceae bacterium]